MNITRQEPWNLLAPFVTRFVAQRRRTAQASPPATREWNPAVDIQEEADRFIIRADVPGADPKDIEVRMECGILSITGQRPSESEASRAGYQRIERMHGSFQRRFRLPDTANAEDITATAHHGVLEVIIPKRHKAQPRRIEVTG